MVSIYKQSYRSFMSEHSLDTLIGICGGDDAWRLDLVTLPPYCKCLVAENDDENDPEYLKGFLIYEVRQGMVRNVVSIHLVCSNRHQGGRLMRRLIADHAPPVRFETTPIPSAVGFYRKLGFREVPNEGIWVLDLY